MSEVTSMLPLVKSKQTVTVHVDRHVDLVVSMFMSTVDKCLSLAFSDKGNATVTFDGPKLHKW